MPALEGGAPRSRRRLLVWVVVAAVFVRVGSALFQGNEVSALPGIWDQISYHALALRLLDGHGFSFATDWWPATRANEPTAHWSYLYVLFLAATYGVVGPVPLAARVVQAVAVGVLHPWLTWRIATRLFGSRVGLVAAGLVAVYAYFVYYAGGLLTEAFYLVAVLWVVDRTLRLAETADRAGESPGTWTWAAWGLAVGFAALLRQVFLLVVPILLGWLLWRYWGGAASRKPRVHTPARGVLVAMATVAVLVLPWTARNYRAFGEVVPLNTNAGFAFFWGSHPVHGSTFVPILKGEGAYRALIPPELSGLNEAQLDRALLVRGLGFVSDDPVRYLWLCAGRAKEYFKFWPSSESGAVSNLSRVASFGICLPFMLLGVVLALGGWGADGNTGDDEWRRAGATLLVMTAAGYTALHIMSWALIRYRLPVDALLMPFAALGLTFAWERLAIATTRVEPGRVCEDPR